MANTYSCSFEHIIWSTKCRERTITADLKDRVEQLLTKIAEDKKANVLSVCAMPEHIHLLVKVPPTLSVSDLVGSLKRRSSKLINEGGVSRLYWQIGFGAFSISESHVKRVIRYIEGQAKHHKEYLFEAEYKEWLDKYGADYDERYVFG